ERPSFLSSTSFSNISAVSFGASPRDGSSRIIILGLVISARPMLTICCSPPLSLPTLSLALSLSLGKSPYTKSRVVPAACLARREYAPSIRLVRSEEHTSELQSRFELVCRLLLEKKK